MPQQKIIPHVDETQATLQLIQMILLFARGRSSIKPISINAKKSAFKLLGLRSLQTKDKELYWQFAPNTHMHLARAGLDPITGILIDHSKFELALRELEQQKTADLEAKCMNQDLQAKHDAIHKALQTYRPTKPPPTTTPQKFLHDYSITRHIANHLLHADQER